MFVSVKFQPADGRSYTYTYDGTDPITPGQMVWVDAKGDKKPVTVHEVDLPAPAFECKPIIGIVPQDAADILKWKTENEGMIAVADHVSKNRHGIGGNNPPDPIDQITGQYEAEREEAENWLDGSPVETEGQMKAVDALRAAMREWRLELERGQKSATAPLYEAYKAEGARWKPTIEDAKRIEAGLVSVVDGFKRKLAAEKEAARKAAEAKAWEETRKAQEAARLADAANIEATRAAAAQIAAAEEAQRQAALAAKDTVKGLRTVTRHEIESHKAALHWIVRNDRDATTAFIEDYVRRNHKAKAIDGVRVWQDRETF